MLARSGLAPMSIRDAATGIPLLGQLRAQGQGQNRADCQLVPLAVYAASFVYPSARPLCLGAVCGRHASTLAHLSPRRVASRRRVRQPRIGGAERGSWPKRLPKRRLAGSAERSACACGYGVGARVFGLVT